MKRRGPERTMSPGRRGPTRVHLKCVTLIHLSLPPERAFKPRNCQPYSDAQVVNPDVNLEDGVHQLMSPFTPTAQQSTSRPGVIVSLEVGFHILY